MADAGELWSAVPAGLAALAFGYLAGSIPFGLVITRLAGMEDIRTIGSGNIGATNVLRTGRRELAAATLALDALKGTIAVLVARHFGGLELASIAGFGAFLGHLFPVWLKFRGGKGVATGLGAFVVIAPKAVLVAALIFMAVVAISRYVSLGSIVAVAVFPLMAWLIGQFYISLTALALISLASFLILIKHRDNIRRLLAGTESRLGVKRA